MTICVQVPVENVVKVVYMHAAKRNVPECFSVGIPVLVIVERIVPHVVKNASMFVSMGLVVMDALHLAHLVLMIVSGAVTIFSVQ